MRIQSIELHRFKRLEVPGIKHLEIAFDSKFQVILGSNGSGKSSVLRELLPSAPTKTLFPKGSHKTLRLEHNGDIYELTYSNSHGHVFIKNDDNLNMSGKNTPQTELIKEHFGIDGNTSQILNGSLPLVSMRPALRQTTLVAMNPANTQLFSDKRVEVRKQVSVLNNQISLLRDRQSQILSQMLPKEELDEVKAKVESLRSDEKVLLVEMTRISGVLDNVRCPKEQPTEETIVELKNEAKHVLSHIIAIGISDVDTISERVSETQAKISLRKQQASDLSDSIIALAKRIDETERTLSALDDTTNSDERLLTLKSQLTKYDLNEEFKSDHLIPEKDIPSVSQGISEIINKILRMSEFEYGKILSKPEVEEKLRVLSSLETSKGDLLKSIEFVESQLTELRSIQPTKPYQGDCPKDQCGLYSEYASSVSKVTDRVDKLKAQLKQYNSELTKVDKEISSYEGFGVQTVLWSIITDILHIGETHPVLFYILDRNNLHKQLNESSKRVINTLRDYITASKNQVIVTQLNTEIANLETQKQQMVSVNDNTKSMLKAMRESTYKEKRHATKTLEDLQDQIQKDISAVQSLIDSKQARGRLEDIVGKAEKVVDDAIHYADYHYLTTTYTAMKETLESVRSDLTSGSTFLQEQLALLSNLDSDINTNLTRLKRDYDDYKCLETSLVELSHKYMKTFLNTIIELANSYISEVFNYPISLVPFTDRNIDFIFPVLINESIQVRDMSECSDAQQVIIELSMNLALASILELNDYPLLLDEKDRALDPVIRENLYSLLMRLSDQGVVSQIILINHHTDFINSSFCDMVVLDSANLKLSSETVNRNTTLEYY